MDTIEAILRRRSLRGSFDATRVETHILESILRCGLAAPSSKNAKPWRFHVVTDSGLLDELARLVEAAEGKDTYVPHDPATGQPWAEWPSTVDQSAAVLRSAPAAIFVENLGRFSRSRKALLSGSSETLAGLIIGYTLEILGIGAAIQNMWIAAFAHGLSGVFMGDILIADEAIQVRLGMSADLVGVLVLGYSAWEDSRQPAPLDASKVHWL